MRIVIIGGGGQGRVIIDVVEKLPQFELVGIVDSGLTVGERVLGYEVLGGEDDLSALCRSRDVAGVIIAIGDNWQRSQVVRSVAAACPRLEFPAAVHPSAQVGKDAVIGRGTVVMAGAVVNPNAHIGGFCILNTLCSVDHDSRVADYVSFAPHSCSGGDVEVGAFAAVGLGANIIHGVRIGEHSVIGAGATVVKDLPSHVVAYGTPAQVIRQRAASERYL